MSGCCIRWVFALRNSQMSRAKGCRPLVLRDDICEAVADDTGRAGERVDVWTLPRQDHRRRGLRPPMYQITGHYPMVVSVGRGSIPVLTGPADGRAGVVG